MPPSSTNRSINHRSRSVHRRRPLVVAVLAWAMAVLALIALVTCGVFFAMDPSSETTVAALLASLAAAVVLWIIASVHCRRALCPLCKGTPFHACGALPHIAARRLPPLNHATSALLDALFTHRFTCMYCGSRFDLLKAPSFASPNPQKHQDG